MEEITKTPLREFVEKSVHVEPPSYPESDLSAYNKLGGVNLIPISSEFYNINSILKMINIISPYVFAVAIELIDHLTGQIKDLEPYWKSGTIRKKIYSKYTHK